LNSIVWMGKVDLVGRRGRQGGEFLHIAFCILHSDVGRYPERDRWVDQLLDLSVTNTSKTKQKNQSSVFMFSA
jgi:hypothetical protein